MKIVHAYKDYYPPLMAGITRYMAMVASAAAASGHDVEVVVSGVRTSRTETTSDGVVVRRIAEFGRALSNPISPQLAVEVSRIRADVLHLHLPNPLTELGALRQRTPIIASFHAQVGKQSLVEPVYRPIQRRILEKSRQVLVASPAMLEAPEIVPFANKTLMLPYGVDPALVGKAPVLRAAGEPVRMLFVGRLVYYKGLDVLLDAMEGLTDLSLTVIGEGPLRQHVEARIGSSPQLSQSVRLLGGVTDQQLAGAYREHNVFVAPSVSRAEAFGISMAEALSNGLPAISSALGTGTDWVNEDERSGLVITPGDPEALRSAIVRLQDLPTWQRLSRGAADLASERYSSEAHFKRLMQLYESVAST